MIDLDPDYRWAVVGHPSRDYGWILSRTRTLPDETFRGILQRLKQQGYDDKRFIKVPHRGNEQQTASGTVSTFRPVVAR